MRYRTVTYFAPSKDCRPGRAVFACLEIEDRGFVPEVSKYLNWGSITRGPWIDGFRIIEYVTPAGIESKLDFTAA